MASRYLDPTNDVAFKKIFSDKERLKDFLNAVLRLEEGRKIVELAFIPQEELPLFHLLRRSIFDLKCVDQEGKVYIVEMQNRPHEAFLNRMQSYASHAYISQAIRGATHAKLMPVILLALVKHKLFPDKIDCISYHYTVESKTKEQFLFAHSYVFIELSKFTKTAEELSSVEDEWLYFFSNWHALKEPPSTTKDPMVLEAYQTIEQFNWNEAAYDAYFRARLAAEAEEDELTKSFEEGMEEGEQIGLEKARIDMARKIFQKGMDLQTVSEVTGFSLEKLKEFLKTK